MTIKARVARLERFASEDGPFHPLSDHDLYRAIRRTALDIIEAPASKPNHQAEARRILGRVEGMVSGMAVYHRKPEVAQAVAANVAAGHLPQTWRTDWLCLAEEWGM